MNHKHEWRYLCFAGRAGKVYFCPVCGATRDLFGEHSATKRIPEEGE